MTTDKSNCQNIVFHPFLPEVKKKKEKKKMARLIFILPRLSQLLWVFWAKNEF